MHRKIIIIINEINKGTIWRARSKLKLLDSAMESTPKRLKYGDYILLLEVIFESRRALVEFYEEVVFGNKLGWTPKIYCRGFIWSNGLKKKVFMQIIEIIHVWAVINA